MLEIIEKCRKAKSGEVKRLKLKENLFNWSEAKCNKVK